MNREEICQKLISFVTKIEEIENALSEINPCVQNNFHLCFTRCFYKVKLGDTEDFSLNIESVLDFLQDELNTGHWSDIPINVRQAFSAASFLKTLFYLQYSTKTLESCLTYLDMGLLLGAPLNENSELLTSSATFLSEQIEILPLNFLEHNEKKRKRGSYSDKFGTLNFSNINTVTCPSLETFNNMYFKAKVPVKLKDSVTHWPALKRWSDLNYLLKLAGNRTVPIEIGSQYDDENWSQKLMTLQDFIKMYFFENSDAVGYLAQHNLFDQISELRKDIHIPDYCCLSDGDDNSEPDINAWFGPANTISPLHHDPKNNLLVQVVGTKQIILFPPEDSEHLYPHGDTLLSNTAKVDPVHPNLEEFPNFVKARGIKCLLEPSDIIYIPPKWWHHVTALDKSFSVSFWWI